jgi:hypothetical protein
MVCIVPLIWGIFLLQLLVYHTSSTIGWMGFVTVDACEIAVLDLPGAGAGEVMLCTFHTSRCVPAVVFRVSVFLTTHALGYFPFGMRRFKFHYRV